MKTCWVTDNHSVIVVVIIQDDAECEKRTEREMIRWRCFKMTLDSDGGAEPRTFNGPEEFSSALLAFTRRTLDVLHRKIRTGDQKKPPNMKLGH